MTKTTRPPGKKWLHPIYEVMGYDVYFDVRSDMSCVYTVFDVQSGRSQTFTTEWGFRTMAKSKAEIMQYVLGLE